MLKSHISSLSRVEKDIFTTQLLSELLKESQFNILIYFTL